jgi:uncharacterized protein YhbP (UPF0306 family)
MTAARLIGRSQAGGQEARQLASALLEEQSTLALATVSEDGAPHVTPLFYLPGEGLSLYWFSSPRSRHSRNLGSNPKASVTVYRPTDAWREICGVQMQGVASVLTGRTARAEIQERYTARFRLGATFRAALRASRLYVFRPDRVRYLDNGKGFGFKAEFQAGVAAEE